MTIPSLFINTTQTVTLAGDSISAAITSSEATLLLGPITVGALNVESGTLHVSTSGAGVRNLTINGPLSLSSAATLYWELDDAGNTHISAVNASLGGTLIVERPNGLYGPFNTNATMPFISTVSGGVTGYFESVSTLPADGSQV